MVGARGFEPPTAWFRRLVARRISNSHGTIRIGTEYDKCNRQLRLATTHRHEIALGRVWWWAQIWAQSRAPSRAPNWRTPSPRAYLRAPRQRIQTLRSRVRGYEKCRSGLSNLATLPSQLSHCPKDSLAVSGRAGLWREADAAQLGRRCACQSAGAPELSPLLAIPAKQLLEARVRAQ